MKKSKEHCHLEARDVGFEVSEFSTSRTSSAADCLLEGCFGFGPYDTVTCTWG